MRNDIKREKGVGINTITANNINDINGTGLYETEKRGHETEKLFRDSGTMKPSRVVTLCVRDVCHFWHMLASWAVTSQWTMKFMSYVEPGLCYDWVQGVMMN